MARDNSPKIRQRAHFGSDLKLQLRLSRRQMQYRSEAEL